MKFFFAIISSVLIIQLINPVSSTSTFPIPDFSNATDAIELPQYKEALKRMFPHIDYEVLVNTKNSKIIRGEASNLGDFPYQVLIYMSSDNIYWNSCGGILIKREWVLTAGHCVFGFTHYRLYFGLIRRPPSDNSAWTTTVTGSQFINLHEKFDKDTLANDVALIFLPDAPEDFLEYPNVGIAELPEGRDGEINLEGVVASISGFGRVIDNGAASNFLKNTTAPITTNEQCAETFGPYILNSNLCLDTSNGAGSSCRGDSGGPLTAEIEPNRRVLVGVVSFGAASGCALGHPDVYSRVTFFLNWIYNIIDPQPVPPTDGNCNCVCNCFTCPANI